MLRHIERLILTCQLLFKFLSSSAKYFQHRSTSLHVLYSLIEQKFFIDEYEYIVSMGIRHGPALAESYDSSNHGINTPPITDVYKVWPNNSLKMPHSGGGSAQTATVCITWTMSFMGPSLRYSRDGKQIPKLYPTSISLAPDPRPAALMMWSQTGIQNIERLVILLSLSMGNWGKVLCLMPPGYHDWWVGMTVSWWRCGDT